MAAQYADANEREAICRFALNSALVKITKTVQYDLLAAELAKDEVCQKIVVWIENGERLKKVTLRGEHGGQAPFEMKPRLKDVLFYLKVTVCESGEPDEYMLIVSAHPDH